jgi:hypothetical protein
VVLVRAPGKPRDVTLAGQPLTSFVYSAKDGLLWLRFANEARMRELAVTW